MTAHNGRKYGSQQAKIEPIKLYDRGPARINLPVKPKIFRTAFLVKVVISAMADFSTQRLILFLTRCEETSSSVNENGGIPPVSCKGNFRAFCPWCTPPGEARRAFFPWPSHVVRWILFKINKDDSAWICIRRYLRCASQQQQLGGLWVSWSCWQELRSPAELVDSEP